uniref:Alpha-1,6-mannosyl-glycoprotein 2-beta-N-acetylglucosaminyltransferase n=1 Tax=Hirondellea gigas TaxID=1518452 RepID=A0A6A7FY52_9CRUS
MNSLVTSITEFRAMTMFFPFNRQLHPKAFPGIDPRDCSRNYNKIARGNRVGVCLNEDWPDQYGHYREAHLTQLKHHWWWKLHRVFEELDVTKGFTGDVLFLEDDYYVAPDVLYVVRMLRASPQSKDSLIISVGNFLRYIPSTYQNRVFLTHRGWFQFSIGFAFNNETWQKIKQNGEKYCTYDDYNWDWTMSTLIKMDKNIRGGIFGFILTRIHHLGSCNGTHAKQKNDCNLDELVKKVEQKIVKAEKYLFPASMFFDGSFKNAMKTMKAWGGWGDLRDVELCKAITNGTASDDTLTRLQFEDFVVKT